MSSSTNFFDSARRWMPWQDAESKALGSQDIEVNTDRLNIRSSANAGRGGNAQAKGIEDSNIDFTGNQANVNAFARTRDGDAEAIGLEGSSLDTGSGADHLNIRASAHTNRGDAEAIGLEGSSLDTGSGADRLNINASARTRDGYAEAVGLDASSLDTGSALIT